MAAKKTEEGAQAPAAAAKPAATPKPKREKKGKEEAAGGLAKQAGQQERANKKPRLQGFYEKEVAKLLQKEFSYKNSMQVPQVKKVVLNMGLGEAVQNPKIIESAEVEIATISGQKAVITRSRKSISNFKLREGLPIGVMVTLRRQHMWEFLDRLMNIALPRVRDFRGVSPKGFDGQGNFTLGIREQIIFPEINVDKLDKVKGMNISIVTTAKTDAEARALLTHLGMPFRK